MTIHPFHPGELAVQRRAGVEAMARRVGHSIHASVPPAAAAFLAERSWVVLATTDAEGYPWASLVGGDPGFARAVEATGGGSAVELATIPHPGDPLAANLHAGGMVGLLAIDLATRRRMRINGHLADPAPGMIRIAAEQVYGNCPKYIQRRVAEGLSRASEGRAPGTEYSELLPQHREWLRRSDTCFVASSAGPAGADASHRGGLPGFVSVEGNRVRWPDYAGNMMFNTLGNIEASGRAGILVPDFTSGDALLLTGAARIEAERAVALEVKRVVELEGVVPERLRLVEYSPFLAED